MSIIWIQHMVKYFLIFRFVVLTEMQAGEFNSFHSSSSISLTKRASSLNWFLSFHKKKCYVFLLQKFFHIIFAQGLFSCS